MNRSRDLSRASLARRPGSPSSTSTTTRRPEVREAWLSRAFVGVIAGGLVLVVAPDWTALGWLNRGIARAFFGQAIPPAGAEALRHWLYGVEGATLVACGVPENAALNVVIALVILGPVLALRPSAHVS